jgi:hypothetical protein
MDRPGEQPDLLQVSRSDPETCLFSDVSMSLQRCSRSSPDRDDLGAFTWLHRFPDLARSAPTAPLLPMEVIVGLRHRRMVELAKAEAAKHSHLHTSSWPTTMVRDPEGVSCSHAPAP